jgi:hypothetical protein
MSRKRLYLYHKSNESNETDLTRAGNDEDTIAVSENGT